MTCVCQAGGRAGEQQIRTVVTINEEVEKQRGAAGKAKIELQSQQVGNIQDPEQTREQPKEAEESSVKNTPECGRAEKTKTRHQLEIQKVEKSQLTDELEHKRAEKIRVSSISTWTRRQS